MPPVAFLRGLKQAGLDAEPGQSAPVTEDDLAGLPTSVRRYLGFMRVVGRPPDWSFGAHLTGRFRRSDREPWMPADAWQYNSRLELVRMFRMRLLFGGCVPMTGWDTYRHGRGRMEGKLLGVYPVAEGGGEPFDIGELTTYLNDAVLLAPGMLLALDTSWFDGSDDTFRVELRDAGRAVSAEVSLDANGAPTSFTTTDRFMDRPGGPVRTRWSTPVDGWTVVQGRRVCTSAAAEWHLASGPLRYAELSLRSIGFNMSPVPSNHSDRGASVLPSDLAAPRTFRR